MRLFRIAALSSVLVAFAALAAQETGHGIDLAGIDHSVAPGDDFYKYANGAWIKTAVIPPDRATDGPGAVLTDKTRERVRGLIENAAKAKPTQGSDAQKVGDYYASYLDEAGIEAKGLAPLSADMAHIAAIKDKATLSSYLGSTLRADVDALNSTNFYTDHVFGVWITQGFSDPDHNVPYLLQGGLGMPDRDYYIEQTPQMAKLRDQYRAHIVNVLKLAKIADADKKAAAIFALETRIAQTHATREASEDVHKADNPWKRADFTAKAPGMDWNAYFGAAGLGSQNDFIVWHPSAVVGISKLVAGEPVALWKDYLTFHLINHYSRRAAEGLRRRAFRVLRHRSCRARRRTATAGSARSTRPTPSLGEAVGKIYAAKYFPPSSKTRDPGDGEGSARRLSRAHRKARLDVAPDQGEGAGQARHALCRRRLSR